MAAITGLREGEKIIGEAAVSFADFCRQNQSGDVIYYGFSNLDNHAKNDAFESRDYRDWITLCNMWGYNIVIPVPAGALIPKGHDGLLSAGRGISVDHAFATGLRMHDDIQKSGEAAATIAWLAIRHNSAAKDIPYAELKAELEKTSCLFATDTRICVRQYDGTGRFLEFISNSWYSDPNVIIEHLASDAPGFSLWSAKLLDGPRGQELEGFLIDELSEDNSILSCNCALALALRGNPACESVLLKMISDKSGYAPSNGWTHNNLMCVSAISAAGRLGLISAIPLLTEIIMNERYADDIVILHDGSHYEFMTSTKDIYFQLFTHSIMSLYEIAQANPKLKPSIHSLLTRSLSRGNAAVDVSLVARKDKRLDVRNSIIAVIDDLLEK